MFFGTLSIIITLLLSSTIFFHKPTNQRFKTTLGLFSGNYELINQATANRLPIWSTAINIFKNNPVNGIGPRGFRHVYTEYSSPEDYWHKRTQTQAHLLVLEVLAETGLIGFLGYSFALFFIFNLLLKSRDKKALIPYFIPVIVAMFPINTHMAFYGSIWSSMTWLLLTLYFSEMKKISSNN